VFLKRSFDHPFLSVAILELAILHLNHHPSLFFMTIPSPRVIFILSPRIAAIAASSEWHGNQRSPADAVVVLEKILSSSSLDWRLLLRFLKTTRQLCMSHRCIGVHGWALDVQ
jgi:hypothetical protein